MSPSTCLQGGARQPLENTTSTYFSQKSGMTKTALSMYIDVHMYACQLESTGVMGVECEGMVSTGNAAVQLRV